MVITLTGWVDAGGAGAGAMNALSEQLEDAEVFGSIDVAEMADLQQTRPIARWEDDACVIDWPRINFECGRLAGGREGAGRDLVLIRGPEPSLRWPALASSVVEAARRLGVRQAATLGGIPVARVTPEGRGRHRFRDPAFTRAGAGPAPARLRRTDRSADGHSARPGRRRHSGCGLVGAGTAVRRGLAVAARDSRALLGRLAETYNLGIDLRALDERSQAYLRRVESGLDARPDVKAVVDQIDERQESGTGDLVAEIEQFLRSQPGTDEA